MPPIILKKALPKFLVSLICIVITHPLFAENNLDPELLIGTWAEEHNSKKISKASEYSEKILSCTQAGKKISCEGSSLYKAEGLPEAGTNTGQVTGIVQIAKESSK